ncbi:hypothetical protein HY485_01150 [Candidatus Woesearchaeota archaeon]|nr:hypothetical protein [Candidatus Woesearchaeota archaeon]
MTKTREENEFKNGGIPNEFSTPFQSKKEKRGRGIPLCVKVSPTEFEKIKVLKGATPISQFLREKALGVMKDEI